MIGIEDTSYYKYAQDVLSGKLVAGELVKLACNRFLTDLEREDLEFRPHIVERFIRFSRMFKHFKGKSSGKTFILEPWQEFVAANIIGFYWKDTDIRRYTTAVLCISRKQGKTALAALFCLWFLIADGESSPEVDLSANSRKQSMVAYEFVEEFSKQIDPKHKDLKVYRNAIKCIPNIGKLNVFASDSTKLDGFNASFFLVDEMGAARDSKMYDVLRSSQGQRKNPLGMIISTAGFDLSSPYYTMCNLGAEILHGTKTDDASFFMIYMLDEGDDWTDKKNWPKIAPNLNVTVDEKYLQDQVVYARNNPSAEVGVLTKNFNKWCQSSEVWIPEHYILKCTQDIDFAEIYDENTCLMYGGIDLASVADMTAVTILMVDTETDKHYFKTYYYLPSSALDESPNREMYRNWQRSGELIVCNGNVTDYDYILNTIIPIYNEFGIRKIGYDPYNSTQFVVDATSEGLPMCEYNQNLTSFNKPTRELERLILSGQAVIDNNEITRWMFRNVALKSDWNNNVKPVKSADRQKKIDGVISMIEALGVYLKTPKYSNQIFKVG